MAAFLRFPEGERLVRTEEQIQKFIEATKRINEKLEKVRSESIRDEVAASISASKFVVRRLR